MPQPAAPLPPAHTHSSACDASVYEETIYACWLDPAQAPGLPLPAPGFTPARIEAAGFEPARLEPWSTLPVTRRVGPALVTLDHVPHEVDGAWWARHAHLFHDLDENGRLFLEPGSAHSWAQPGVVPERISGARGDWARTFTRRLRRLRNAAKCLRACQGLDPHVSVMLPEGTGPEGVDPAALARLVSAAARRPLGIGAGLRSADWSTASSLLASLADGGVLFLDRSSLGRGPGRDVPGDDARKLSIPLRGALLEGLTQGSLTSEVCDGVMQRDITLWLPWFVVVVVSSDESQGFDPAAGPEGHAEPPGRVRSSRCEPQGAERRGPSLGIAGREDSCASSPRSVRVAAGGRRHRVRTAGRRAELPNGHQGAPNVRRGAPNMRHGTPNVRHGAPNVRRSGPSMLWTP